MKKGKKVVVAGRVVGEGEENELSTTCSSSDSDHTLMPPCSAPALPPAWRLFAILVADL